MMSQIDINSVQFALSKDKDATWYAAASLLRVEIIMRSVAGRESVGALKKKRNQKLRSLVQPIIASLPTIFVFKAQEVFLIIAITFLPENVNNGD